MAAEIAGGSRVVLVGAGHAHLHVVARSAGLQRAGVSVTLVSHGLTGYSGMASGVLGGRYGATENLIDPALVARAAGVQHRNGRVTEIDRFQGVVRLDGGETLPYDWISFNIGSVVAAPESVADGPWVWAAKPVDRLAALRAALLEETREANVVVVGGGATGAEITANLAALADAQAQPVNVTLLEAADRLLSGAPAGAAAALEKRLRQRGVSVFTNTGCRGVVSGGVDTARGKIPADHVVFATGLEAPPLVERLGIPADRAGGIHVDATLRSPADERIFAVGDCAKFLPSPLPRIGVFGVRQAPVLLDNLVAAVSGGEPRSYRPQRRWLSILDLGDATGLLLYGRFWYIGRSALRLKRRLDLGFVRGFNASVA